MIQLAAVIVLMIAMCVGYFYFFPELYLLAAALWSYL